eukprot:Skav223746  [mRNA]  locus=scaffold3575:168972:169503:- [translate_table: standard]
MSGPSRSLKSSEVETLLSTPRRDTGPKTEAPVSTPRRHTDPAQKRRHHLNQFMKSMLGSGQTVKESDFRSQKTACSVLVPARPVAF